MSSPAISEAKFLLVVYMGVLKSQDDLANGELELDKGIASCYM
jgi:hypothetical protein